MKISTKGRYGLRALVDLVINSRGEHISLSSIAERQNISEQYMEHVFSTLRKAGIVNSVKGPRGGYTLSSQASHVKVSAILEALEGDLSIAETVTSGTEGNFNCIEYSITELLWERVDFATKKILDETTLQDLADDSLKREAESCHMYYI